jgi:hypothetical protein
LCILGYGWLGFAESQLESEWWLWCVEDAGLDGVLAGRQHTTRNHVVHDVSKTVTGKMRNVTGSRP